MKMKGEKKKNKKEKKIPVFLEAREQNVSVSAKVLKAWLDHGEQQWRRSRRRGAESIGGAEQKPERRRETSGADQETRWDPP
jgi:hypothetical protein